MKKDNYSIFAETKCNSVSFHTRICLLLKQSAQRDSIMLAVKNMVKGSIEFSATKTIKDFFFSKPQQKGQVKICNFIIFLGFVEISLLNHIRHVCKIGEYFTNF